MRLVLALIVFLSCGLAEQSTDPVAILTSINGGVMVVRANKNLPCQAVLLDYLYNADTLVVADTSSATIFFKDGTLQKIPSNQSIVINVNQPDTADITIKESIIPSEIPALFNELCSLKGIYDGMVSKKENRSEDTLNCIIHYPGNTALIDARPRVIWSKYPGANWYTMRVRQGSDILLSIATTDTIFSFPENDEDMQPGSYKLQLLAVHNSDTLCKTVRSFSILDSLSIHKIHVAIENINRQEIDDFTFHLLKAVFLRKKSLRIMAIESYNKLLALNPSAPVLYKGLAELYYAVGLQKLGDAYLNLSKQKITTFK